jgi:hypothetical protein
MFQMFENLNKQTTSNLKDYKNNKKLQKHSASLKFDEKQLKQSLDEFIEYLMPTSLYAYLQIDSLSLLLQNMHGQLTWQHENHMLNKAKMKFTSSSWVC